MNEADQDGELNHGGYSYEISVPVGTDSQEPLNRVVSLMYLGPDGETVIFFISASYYPWSMIWREMSIKEHIAFVDEDRIQSLGKISILTTESIALNKVRRKIEYRALSNMFQQGEEFRKVGD